MIFSVIRRRSIFSESLIASLISSTSGLIICLRPKARSWRVRAVAFPEAFRISSISSRNGLSLSTSINANWALPMMVVSRLLKSWATPPARVPMASIFWAWRSWVSNLLRSVMSRETASSRSTLPSLPMIGVMIISHHFSVPFSVGQQPAK